MNISTEEYAAVMNAVFEILVASENPLTTTEFETQIKQRLGADFRAPLVAYVLRRLLAQGDVILTERWRLGLPETKRLDDEI
jgi:hypothetical protein